DGDVTVKGDHSAPLIAALGWTGFGKAPALLRPFTLSAKTSAGPSGIALSDVSVDLGGSAAKGVIEWRRERTPQFTVSLDFAPITLEDWRPGADGAPAPAPAAAPETAGTVEDGQASGLTAEIALRFPALSFRGQGLRDGRMTATLEDGELKISDF